MTLNQLIGIGLRHPHYIEVINSQPDIGWFEVHSENFFHQGGPALDALRKIRETYAISLHGVGLSLGSSTGIDLVHLKKIKSLISEIDPFLVSEHLSWGKINNIFLPDLLPLPYTQESLNIICQNIQQTQDYLQREILIENPSSYLEYNTSELSEADFLVELCKKSGAKILLDINNIFVSAHNHQWDTKKYIDNIPADLVKEFHLAGHSHKNISENKIIKIDTHNNKVCDEVWMLYDFALSKFGPVHSLIEWDVDIPELNILLAEALKAKNYCNLNLNRQTAHVKA